MRAKIGAEKRKLDPMETPNSERIELIQTRLLIFSGLLYRRFV